MAELLQLLHDIGLLQHADCLWSNEIGITALAVMKDPDWLDQDWIDLGIPVADGRLMVAHSAAMASRRSSPSEAPSICLPGPADDDSISVRRPAALSVAGRRGPFQSLQVWDADRGVMVAVTVPCNPVAVAQRQQDQAQEQEQEHGLWQTGIAATNEERLAITGVLRAAIAAGDENMLADAIAAAKDAGLEHEASLAAVRLGRLRQQVGDLQDNRLVQSRHAADWWHPSVSHHFGEEGEAGGRAAPDTKAAVHLLSPASCPSPASIWGGADVAPVGESGVAVPVTVGPTYTAPQSAGHAMCTDLLAECDPEFEVEDCRRLLPRLGQLQGGGTALDLDWMDTTDGFHGFKKLHYFPNIALAVSKTGKMEVGKLYDAPAGWHWGSKAEVAAIMGSGHAMRQPAKCYYENQGGWDAYTWGGVKRVYFVFSDTLQVGGILDVGNGEGKIRESAPELRMSIALSPKLFAGIVCVAD